MRHRFLAGDGGDSRKEVEEGAVNPELRVGVLGPVDGYRYGIGEDIFMKEHKLGLARVEAKQKTIAVDDGRWTDAWVERLQERRNVFCHIEKLKVSDDFYVGDGQGVNVPVFSFALNIEESTVGFIHS